MRVFALRIILLGVDSILYSQIIFLHNKEKRLVLYNLTCGLLNVLLNWAFLSFLTPCISILCTLASEIIFTTLCLLYIRKHLKVKVGIFQFSTLKYLLVSLLFVPIVFTFRSVGLSNLYMLVVSCSVCILTYFLVLAIQKDTVYLELKSYAFRIFNR